MPNVSSRKSSRPPVSGNVDDPLNPDHETPYQTVELPHTGLYKQQGILDNLCEDQPSRDDGNECGHEKSREEVIKEIAISSAAFIGPVCRPDTTIEEKLNDFYKELEEIDQKDVLDGSAGVKEDLSQPCAPAPRLSPKKETRETEHNNAYRPYPATRPQRDNGNNRTWRPQSHNDMTWYCSDSHNNQNQWQQTPHRLQHDPSRLPFPGPHHFYPPPPHGNPMQPLHFQPQLSDYSHADNSSWSLWERPNFPLGYDMRLSSSNCSSSSELHERNSYDWQYYEAQDRHHHNSSTPLILILMRGVPGSGKTTLAKEILSSGPNGLILSTDDYFFQKGGYFFDPTLLGDAHDWNQKRAKEAMLEGRSPVIIDNTNVKAWEMKPYVALALHYGYRVEFVEPDTSWKCDPIELEKRNTHGVPRESIAKMLDRFDLPINVDVVMNSWEPPHKSKDRHSKPYGQTRFEYI
ncbi:NEDD4-binding protein 2-like 2 [Hoplias malabaricus]|uniref:NEDD4-binding protein 2-like 2 n=1 Tax=Hoplias malabaricus TaxID=27720 RepID=UPI0034621CE2